MSDYEPPAIDSFTLAASFLQMLDKEHHDAYTRVLRKRPARIPSAPQGYAIQENVSYDSPFFAASTSVPFSCYSADRVLLCESVDAADLANTLYIRVLWLHLNIACLIVAEVGLTPQALLTCRVQPCIIGMKPLPHECLPLALAALRQAQAWAAEIRNLPF